MSREKIIAVCSCGAHFHLSEVDKVENHITEDSSTAHQWTFVADIIIEEECK